MQLYKDEIDKEMILNAEIQRQNLKSLPKGGIKDRKIKNPVSQQMIDEFKQQFNKKSGDKAFLFPELKPNLIDLTDELKKLNQPLTEYDIYDINDEIDEKLKIYKLLTETMIPQHNRIIGENKNEINVLYGKMENATKPRDIKNLKYKQTKLENEIIKLEGFIIRDKGDVENLQSDINQLQLILNENDELINNYKNLEFTVSEKNKKILSDYSDNIRILNEGKINISQDPDETEEEYLIRLADIAEQEYDDSELLEKAYLSNIIEFKQNMKNILSTEWKIENILNSLDRDEVFLLNKTFKSFEREILKTIGKNNKNIEIGDYVQLIKNHTKTGDIEKIDAKTIIARPFETNDESIYEEEPVEASSVSIPKYTFLGEEDDDIVYELSSDRETLSMLNKLNNRSVYLSFGYQNQVFYKLPYGGLTAFKGNKNTRTFKEKFDSIFKVYLEMNDEQLKREFGETYEKITEQKLAAKLKTQRLQYPNDEMFEGEGIKKLKENLPTFLQFGKVIILLDKLYYKNMLSIKDKNKKNIQGLPNKKVSDKFVDIIMRMIKDDKPAGSGDIYELDDKEQELFTILMYKSGFYKETTTNNKKIIQKLKDRLQLVEGTIKAGNNNEDNFKELYQIIFKMTNLGVISLSNGRSYYKQIKKEYS
jgi:hypothetical protein